MSEFRMSRSYYSEEEWNETPRQRKERLARERAAKTDKVIAKATVSKGACPKCGKHIGRGIAVHVKSCKG